MYFNLFNQQSAQIVQLHSPEEAEDYWDKSSSSQHTPGEDIDVPGQLFSPNKPSTSSAVDPKPKPQTVTIEIAGKDIVKKTKVCKFASN